MSQSLWFFSLAFSVLIWLWFVKKKKKNNQYFFLNLLEVGFTPPGIPTEGKSLSCYCHMELLGTWQPANVAGPTASFAVNHLCASDCGFLQNKGLSHYRCRTDKNGLFSFNYKTQINLSKVLMGSCFNWHRICLLKSIFWDNHILLTCSGLLKL